jgi:aerobic-type carbon monoxide dehydrogenase small subunit (CoxS/CutS family)
MCAVPALRTAFSLNDKTVEVVLDPRVTLADAVRESGATGTRLGCEEGVCGWCTVLVDDRPARHSCPPLRCL